MIVLSSPADTSACDLRYATRDAFFLVQGTNIGITAEVGQLQRLPKVIPEGIEGRAQQERRIPIFEELRPAP